MLLQYLNLLYDTESSEVESEDSETLKWLKPYIPSLINVLLITIFGQVYHRLTYLLVAHENHRFEEGAEDSLINKIYIFQFFNTYFSNFVYIFYNQSFYKLQMNLITVMVFK